MLTTTTRGSKYSLLWKRPKGDRISLLAERLIVNSELYSHFGEMRLKIGVIEFSISEVAVRIWKVCLLNYVRFMRICFIKIRLAGLHKTDCSSQ